VFCKCGGKAKEQDLSSYNYSASSNCIHRDPQVIGTANCGCQGKYDVSWCRLLEGHCTPNTPGKTWLTIETSEGRIDRVGRLPPCLHCKHRSTVEFEDKGLQTRLSGIVAVTALSLNRHKLDHQTRCLDSWIAFGLEVVVRNTREEIETLKPHFPQVSKWIEDEDTTSVYTYPTQKIVNLARTAIELESAVLLINSDIELYGNQDWVTFDERNQFVGIRWNYDIRPQLSTEFQWGLDAFTFTPRQAAFLPADMPYGIGQAMWDYAIPAIMQYHGVSTNLLHRPLLYHRNHQQNWSESGWHIGADWLAEKFGVRISWGSGDYRQSLDPGFTYNGARYVRSGVVLSVV
jgi:hypothetical protein